jgi:hypothetical protein
MDPTIKLELDNNSNSFVIIDGKPIDFKDAENYIINLESKYDREIDDLRCQINLVETEETINFTNSLRISQYCRITKFTSSEVIQALNKLNINGVTENSKIEPKILYALDTFLKYTKRSLITDPKIEALLNLHYKRNSIPTVLEDLKLIKQDSNIIIDFGENIFENVQEEISIGSRKIKSFFTDEEALNICSKMSDSFSRRLVQEFIIEQSTKTRFFLHHRANNALKEFGGFIISFIYKIPKLKQSNIRNTHLKNLFKNKGIVFPVLKIKNPYSDDYLYLTFKENRKSNNKRTINIFRKNTDSYDEIGEINEGKLLTKVRSKIYFDFFTSNLIDGKFDIFAGVETGECIICKRELTAPFSVNNGIGPACAKKIGFNFENEDYQHH